MPCLASALGFVTLGIRNKAGLAHARKLKVLLDEVIRVLEADGKLPEAVQTAPPLIDEVPSPFA